MLPRKYLFVLFVVLALVAPFARAMTSRDLLIPVAGRTPGALGSVWRSDLVITNTGRFDETVNVTFTPANAPVQFKSYAVGPMQTLALRDFALAEFGLAEASGQVRVTAASATGKLTAHARVVNIGGLGGQYGQTVPAVPVDALTRETLVAGLNSENGFRTNFGVTNPWDVAVPVTIEVVEASGEPRGSFTTTVPARSAVQYNNVRNFMNGEPLNDAAIRVTSAVGLYAWASIVRNDSGDPSFVAGSGVATGNELLLPTACANPAAVTLVQPGGVEAPGWIVLFKPETDAAARAGALAAKYAFSPQTVYENAFKGFSAVFSHEVLRSVRCEADVVVIQQNQAVVP